MLSSFTHPQFVPNLYECLSSVKHKRRYLKERMLSHVTAAINFHSKKKINPKKILMELERKKETRMGCNNLMESK